MFRHLPSHACSMTIRLAGTWHVPHGVQALPKHQLLVQHVHLSSPIQANAAPDNLDQSAVIPSLISVQRCNWRWPS